MREIVVCVESELTRQAQARGIDVHEADDRVIAAICDAKTPQGIVAECVIPDTSQGLVLAGTGPVVICDRISDPGNLGTIIRTAEAVGAAGVLVSQGSVDAWNPKVVRSSAGSIFRLPVAQAASTVEAVEATQESGRSVVALTAHADQTVFEVVNRNWDARGPVGGEPDGGGLGSQFAWLVGSEAHGISPEALSASALTARIPMNPEVESLNAAISIAVCLYAALGARAHHRA